MQFNMGMLLSDRSICRDLATGNVSNPRTVTVTRGRVENAFSEITELPD